MTMIYLTVFKDRYWNVSTAIADDDSAMLKNVDLSKFTGDGTSYEEALEAYKEKFKAYMNKVKDFEKLLFSDDPPYPVYVDKNVFYSDIHYSYYKIKRVDNDERITQLLEEPPEIGFIQTLITTHGTCEMTECVHNDGHKRCDLVTICASRCGKNCFLCCNKEISNDAYSKQS